MAMALEIERLKKSWLMVPFLSLKSGVVKKPGHNITTKESTMIFFT
jgi:hypothetical protein